MTFGAGYKKVQGIESSTLSTQINKEKETRSKGTNSIRNGTLLTGRL